MTLTDTKPQGYKIPECIYDEQLTAQSSVVISGLDGNSDEEYKIEIEGAIAVTASPTFTSNLSNGWEGVGLVWNDAPGGPTVVDGDSTGVPKIGEGLLGSGNTNQISIETVIKCGYGRERKIRSDCSFRNAGGLGRALMNAHHTTDTTTNLTTFTITFGGSLTGMMKVYRLLPK